MKIGFKDSRRVAHGFSRGGANCSEFVSPTSKEMGHPSTAQPRILESSNPRILLSPAFTIVELIVVITVIVLILAIAVPGLSALSSESRFSSAVQMVNGALTRAYYCALADGNMTAVRFLPGEWDYDESADAQRPTGRMHMVTYSYVGTSAGDPTQPGNVVFAEYFQRRVGSSSEQLPDNIWAAPAEALDRQQRTIGGDQHNNFGQQFVLNGYLRHFYLDAKTWDDEFLNADDFLIVFDPQTGVRGMISPMPLKAYVPNSEYVDAGIRGTETDRGSGGNPEYYKRYNFTGVAIYRRGGFESLGNVGGAALERQNYLRRNSRPYLVHRYGGGLVMGTQGQYTEE